MRARTSRGLRFIQNAPRGGSTANFAPGQVGPGPRGYERVAGPEQNAPKRAATGSMPAVDHARCRVRSDRYGSRSAPRHRERRDVALMDVWFEMKEAANRGSLTCFLKRRGCNCSSRKLWSEPRLRGQSGHQDPSFLRRIAKFHLSGTGPTITPRSASIGSADLLAARALLRLPSCQDRGTPLQDLTASGRSLFGQTAPPQSQSHPPIR
jgi:hypothetical protein